MQLKNARYLLLFFNLLAFKYAWGEGLVVSYELSQQLTQVTTPTTSFQNLIFAPSNSTATVSGDSRRLNLGTNMSSQFMIGLSFLKATSSGYIDFQVEDDGQGLALFDYVDSQTTVDLEQTGYGVWLGFQDMRSSLTTKTNIFIDRIRTTVKTSNAFDFGGVLTGTREASVESDDWLISLSHQTIIASSNKLNFTVGQSYGLPISDQGFLRRTGGFSFGLGVSLGPSEDDSFQHNQTSSCQSAEIWGLDNFGGFSGVGNASPDDYSGIYDLESSVGSNGHQWGVRYSLDSNWGGCWSLSLFNDQRRLGLGSGEFENLLGIGNSFSSSADLDVGGYGGSIGYIFTNPDRLGGYFSTSIDVVVGEGVSRQKSNYGNVASLNTESVELVLPSLSFASGYRVPIGHSSYLFYEVSTLRYDGRPFGHEIRGWDYGLKSGIGHFF